MTDSVSRIERLVMMGLVPPEEREARAEDVRAFAERLRAVHPQARKLLIHIAELAYHGHGEDRQPDTAYLPELHESCGLDVESMYATLEALKQAELVKIEKEYPFEDVAIVKAPSGWNVLATIAVFCEDNQIPLGDIIVDMRFDLL